MLSVFVGKINKSFWGFLFSGNRKANLPITISVQPRKGVAIRNLETGKLITNQVIPNIKTTTQKISEDEISFIVPNIRFDDANLAGEGRTLNIEVELPNGKVKLEVIGEHYERIGKRTSLASYLIEAKIINVNPLDEEIFRNYLQRGEKVEKSKRESLVFGITDR